MPWTPPDPDHNPGGGTGEDEDECGLTNPTACVSEGIRDFFRDLVTEALNPLLDLLGTTLLATPEPSSIPSLGQLWTESWHILLACYALLVVAAGMVIMAFETLQTRYTVKEIAPRLAVGFLAGTLSLFIATKAIQIANAMAQAVMGEGLDPQTVGTLMAEMVLASLNGGLWLIFLALALVVMVVVLLLTFVVRVMLTIVLIAAAPIALMWHALPHTEGIAMAWWKALGGLLAIQIGQSLTMVVALRVFFAPGGFDQYGPTLSGLMNLLLCLALMWVLIKIPFWCLSSLRTGGRSFVGSLVRGAIAYKTMGLASGLGAAVRGGGGGSGPRTRRSGGGTPGEPPATRSGQFMLPLGVRRTTPQRTTRRRLADEPERTPPVLDSRRPGRGQQSLFTPRGSGEERTVAANPRALPPKSLPHPLPQDQTSLPIATHREPDRVGRRTLQTTGYRGVRVVTGDGANGVPEHAPYDRIVATVSPWDIPEAWWNQLAPGGRIVLPLRWRGQARSVAFGEQEGCLISDSVELCGFVYLVGDDEGELSAPIIEDGTVSLHWDRDQPVDPRALVGVLDQPRVTAWSGATVAGDESHDGIWLRLTVTERRACRIQARPEVSPEVCEPIAPPRSPALVDGGSLAYLTSRRQETEKGSRWELGAIGHGPAAEELTERLCDDIRSWSSARGKRPTVSAYPADTPDSELAPTPIEKTHSRLVLTYGKSLNTAT